MFTPEQRLDIYQRMLVLYKSSTSDSFLCNVLAQIIEESRKLDLIPFGKIIINDFPELMKQKPNDAFIFGPWWDYGDRISRLKALNESIKLIKYTINNGNLPKQK